MKGLEKYEDNKEGEKFEAKLYTIYLWKQGDVVLGAFQIPDGSKKETFGSGWKIESPYWRKEEEVSEELKLKRAMSACVTDCTNTLNVLRLYGSKALDSNGNIDWQKTSLLEAGLASQASEKDWQVGGKYAPRKFPVEVITYKQAFDAKLV